MGHFIVDMCFPSSFEVWRSIDLMSSPDEFVAWVKDFIEANWRPLAQAILLPGLLFILIFVVIAVWFERKYLARAMLRIGPLYAGRVGGVLQLIADFLKLLTKEIVVPTDASKPLFYALPILSAVIPALTVALIPFDPDWVIFRAGGLGLPLFLGISGLVPLVTIFMGWASNNKYSEVGSLRIAYLYMAAEVPMLIGMIGAAVLAQSFDFVGIVEAQREGWFIVPGFVGAIVSFIALIAVAERVPFDIPIAEQEIVAGWRTEYSGALYLMTMLSEYVVFLGWALLFVTTYLGGYLGPIIPGQIDISSFSIEITVGLSLPLHILWVIAKLAVVVAVIMLLRTVFPRLRIDQSLKLCWWYLTPVALLNLALVVAVKLQLFGGIGL